MSVPNSNALIHTFYIWPRAGVNLSEQWNDLRENFENLHPMAKAMQLALDATENHEPKNNDLSGLAHGERDFRNRYRIWYDPDNDRWALQINVGTEAAPQWDDYLTVRDSDGRVTIWGTGGIDSSVGGFYAPLPRNLAKSAVFPLSNEWIFEHDLDTVPVLWDTFDNRFISLVPYKTDVSNPNIAYFYFLAPKSGTAMAVAEQARGEGIRISDGTNIFPGANRLGFNSTDFYLSKDGHGKPVVNLNPIDISNFDTSALIKADGTNPFTGDQSMGGNQLTNVGTPGAAGDAVNKAYADALRLDVELTGGNHAFTDIDKIVFDAQSFYFDTTSGGQPILGLRGTLGSGGSSGNTAFAANFSNSTEWQLAHNLNSSDLNWSVYDDQGLAIIPSKVAVHAPNTAYFYFGNNAMTGRAVVTAAGGSSAADLTPFIRKDGSINFTGNESMGGFKLTNVGTPTVGGDATNKTYVDSQVTSQFYGVIVKDGVHAIKGTVVNFNSNGFYLSQTLLGEPMVNLKYDTDYIPVFDEFPTVHNIVVDPLAPYDYTIESVSIDTKSGSLVGGFYRMTLAQRNKNGVAITGLDPLSVNTNLQKFIPSGNNVVAQGDMIVFSIVSVTSPKHLRIQITGRKP
jgi:hypothetical protein